MCKNLQKEKYKVVFFHIIRVSIGAWNSIIAVDEWGTYSIE